MNIVLFILPLAIFPLLYLALCLSYGKKNYGYLKKKRLLKIKAEYSLFYRYMLAITLLFLLITLLKEEIILSGLGLKDLMIFLLFMTTVFALLKQRRKIK